MDIERIDIKKSIQSKNPKLLKILPRFILNYIRRIIHEEQLNDIIDRYEGVYGLEFAHRMIHDEFKIKAEAKGFDDIDTSKRYIFASNHPWGGLEAIALLDIVEKKFPNPRFIVNDILMSLKNYHPLFIPVNKHGAQGRENVKILEENYRSEKPILIFPAGLVSRREKGKVVDLEWQKNFISKAVQHQREVVPVFIDGHNSNFFYRLAAFRKAIGIKANIEMFFLVDEMFKNKGESLSIYFGKPIPYSTFDNSKTKKEWAAEVKNHVYLLKDDCKRDFIKK